MISKNKNLFLKIYILFVIIISIALIILQILGSKKRVGYLTDFNLEIDRTLELNNLNDIRKDFTVDGKLDEKSIKNYLLTNENITNYVHHFRIRYYDKNFRNNDIYGVYPDLSNLPDYMKNAEMEENGSPYGNFISDKKEINEDKIDNINYILKIKFKFLLILISVIILIFLIYILSIILYLLLRNDKINKFVILFLLFFVLLFLNFNFNVFSLADNNLFKIHDNISSSIVLDNYAIRDLTKTNNFFFLYYTNPNNTDKYNDSKFVNDLKYTNKGLYISHLGGQQFILKPINRYFGYFLENSPQKYIKIYELQQLFTGTLTAIEVALFITFLAVEFGILPVFISSVFLIFTNVWLTIFAKNIYWTIWSYYLPLLIICYYVYKYNFNDKKLIFYILFVISLLIKFSIGYEYISTIMIAYTLPVFYFAISRQWTLKKFIKSFLITSALCVLSFLITISIHIIALGSIKHILYTFLKRTSNIYFDSKTIIEDNGILAILDLYLNKNPYSFPYINIVIIFILVIFLRFVFDKKQRVFGFEIDYKKYLGLLLCVIISFFGAISHQIIFKQHSFVHTAQNYITFFIPFLFLAYILILLKTDVKMFYYLKCQIKNLFSKK
ncbi:hypothetical protein [Brachyspira aalborgi]|uniref:hypothetical protein n=1 Tax=Brachyspira aalborgi TaxID=29522 RepID=UPI002665BCE8|nr:hypothetical protein [Brachyspira aalborgi]